MSRFSERTGWDVAESSYAAAVREARSSGRLIYDLTISNPTRCGFNYDAEALLRADPILYLCDGKLADPEPASERGRLIRFPAPPSRRAASDA